MALTKADFAEQLFDELGLKKREGKDIVELFFEEIKKTLEKNILLTKILLLEGMYNFNFTPVASNLS